MALPITLHVSGRRVVVVGAGSVAARRIAALVAAGAHVCAVAPDISPEAREALGPHGEALERPYGPDDLQGAILVVAATNDESVNAGVARDARALRILLCDATAPERGDVSIPAVVRVGNVTFAVETGGAAPAFAARIAREIEQTFGSGYGFAARALAGMRAYAKAALPPERRAAVLRALANMPIEQLATMNPAEAEHEVDAVDRELFGKPGTPPSTLVCATRASKLATTQAKMVAAQLAVRGTATTLLPVTTTGDRIVDRALTAIGSDSLFVKELEIALRESRADYAVHSCKDLPSELPPDMVLAAISRREDPRDAFCSERYASFAALPAGARVGTSSLRRRSQLAALRPELDYCDVRGNVDSRLRKLRDGEFDAIVLACAGLHRLGAAATHTVPFGLDELVPAVGQGALAVEARAGDDATVALLCAAINDAPSQSAIVCERAALASLQGGCQAPIGIHAAYASNGELAIRGVVATLDGKRIVRARLSAKAATLDDARALGLRLADALRADGARSILEEHPRPPALPLAGKLVLVPRTQERPSRIAAALRADGAQVIEVEASGTEAQRLVARAPHAIVFASSGSVAAAANLLNEMRRSAHRPFVAAMGEQSGAAATAAGFAPDAVAAEATVECLVDVVRRHFQPLESS